MNPYWGKSFIGVFKTFAQRLFGLVSGQISISDLASDELQILVLSVLGVSCAIVGTFLVLKRMGMLANSVSHTILIGIVIPFAFFGASQISAGLMLDMKILLFSSLITALLTMFFTDFLTRVLKIQRDASIGLVFSFLFAVGIIALTILTRNSHIGTEIIMGNVDMLHYKDLYLISSICLVNLAITALLFKELVATAFDPLQAKLSKISHLALSYLLMFMTALTVISGLRAVGVVLVLAFLVIPPLFAKLFSKRVSTMILYASISSVVLSILSVALSRHLSTMYGLTVSTAGLVVTMQFIFYLAAATTRRYLKKLIRPMKEPKSALKHIRKV